MLTERWPEIRSLLEAALDQPQARRSEWLEREVGDDPELLAEVRSLLDADRRAERFLEIDALGALEPLPGPLQPGMRIGSFEVVRILGRGGMGQVVLAVRADDTFRQEVAIKIADQTWGTRDQKRLRRERQILADLDHPNIARLFDGGATTSGWPYLVMEHIEGRPIDRWVERKGWSADRRARLFRKVLSAVAYAHRNLVVHLDLKPSNILVTAQGEPKLLDFGIAKLLTPDASDTATGLRPLSRGYASPEQIRGQRLTVASDIFSLGVVLHQLLTGELPARTGPGLAETTTPGSRRGSSARSTSPARLPRDLGAILARAMRPDPARRYGSAEAFDDDLDRYLDGRPVLARQRTWRYRSGRFLRKHWLVFGLAITLFVAAIGAMAAFSIQARRLAGERDRARLARAEAEDINAFLSNLFHGFDPGELEGAVLTVPQVLDHGVAAMAQLDQRPAVRARLLDTFGRAFRVWGRYAPAAAALEEALALQTKTLGPDHPDVAATLNELGRLDIDRGAYARAAVRHRRALTLYRARPGDDDLPVAETLTLLGDALLESSNLQAASAFLQRGCALRRRLLGAAHPDTARCGTLLAKVEIDLGDAPKALEHATASVRVLEASLGDDHPDLAEAVNMKAYALMRLGRLEKAESAVRRVLSMRRRMYPGGHPRIAETLNNLAILLSKIGRDVEAEDLSQEAIDILVAHFGTDSDRAASARHNLAVALHNQGRAREAEATLRESIGTLRRVLPRSHHRNHPLALLAEILLRQNRAAEALTLAREAHGLTRDALGDDHPRTAYLLHLLERCGEGPTP